ncbi:uncharacterized protein [Nicotiana tomentosiformis]|uniref:uncharacterized protein n=2 Tax=Nicotiana tomentosiformis TaxID=4098 RepID=UPI00388C4CBA
MTAASKPSKQQDKDGNKQPPKKPTGRAAGGPNPQKKRKRTEKEMELLPRQLSDDSEQEEEETLVRRTVKKGITPSKGIEIREPVTYQRKASRMSAPTDKGKEKITTESESDSDSDNDHLQINMSDEDEGEPIDRVDWEKYFVNEKAFRAYKKILVSKKYIPEKPINIGPLKTKYSEFLQSIREVQKWGPILKGHGKANLTIVRELYANWRHARGNIVRVRGIDINVSAEALNNFLRVPHTLTDRFDAICKTPDYAHIKSVLCPTRKDAEWKHGSMEYHSIAKEFMSALARVALNFICNRLLPCQHKTDVPRYRALVLYALLEGIPLNFGAIMHDQMQRTRMNYKWRLFFANTLTAFLTERGVLWDKENDDIEAKAPGPYDVTHVLEPNKGRSSKLTVQQLFEHMQADMQENRAELIATRVELSATRDELRQTRADLSRVQTEQATMMKEISLLLRALVQCAGTDISQLIASSTAGPSTPVPPIVTEAPLNRPIEVAVTPDTESAPVVDDRNAMDADAPPP